MISSPITFEQALELVNALPLEQQEMLVDIVQKRYLVARRREIAQDAQDALNEFRQGQLRPQSASEAIADLRNYLDQAE